MFWNLLLIASGSLVCSVAVNGILLPQQFFGAGFTGVAIIIHYPVPPLPMGGPLPPSEHSRVRPGVAVCGTSVQR